ncbi:ATP-binding cassette domain-containing protein [Tropicimonas isoalkanivorans]|uniref:Molybdate transport system ATP-binding protein n=1 Tax=Tropicimonas isoalkanivorans TaxID=441112 RepID=A0A1I1H7Y3_9RHOB|nr:ATP-binding cassette domain-containing protein [Tropicimonas isoalkanivorans]SFC19702.1 molybdate transport system ATP-binding protein [Tropicimonas isoalkanivorans]
MIEIRVTKRQGAFRLDIDATLPFRGICGLIGPSGSGKSSLFSILAGHDRPDEGVIRADGRTLFDSAAGIDVPPAQRGIGLVFQDGLLFPHLSVRRNLLYGARPGAAARLESLSEALGLSGLLGRRPGRLSGGERQRVAIGRALMAEPRLLLLDEPVSALDPALREDVLGLLETLHAQTGTPMIYISHAPEEIRRLANIVVTLNNGAVADISHHPSPYLRGHTAVPSDMLKAG